MNTQEISFDVTETLSLIAEATSFWQKFNVQDVEALSCSAMDQSGQPHEPKAA
ncbi:hypothetical protein IB221_13865 [Pantoea sp. PNT01]|jgi:hypothetical protein|uniref:hypothetical protein n=1 Tax=Pantoea TaxID=53335 RepID=UPI0015FC9173|nr:MULTISPECIES: hypothetical protein [Pantoea]MBD9553339.1 hypothetical protein [Pantoea sp. PNT01]QNQ59253.1 hypothetical protein IAI47_03020 [Pantoea sp. MT58]